MSAISDLFKGIKKEIRQGYTNQDIWKLVGYAHRALKIGKSEQKPILIDVASYVLGYVESLRYWRKNRSASAALPAVKAKAVALLNFLNNLESPTCSRLL